MPAVPVWHHHVQRRFSIPAANTANAAATNAAASSSLPEGLLPPREGGLHDHPQRHRPRRLPCEAVWYRGVRSADTRAYASVWGNASADTVAHAVPSTAGALPARLLPEANGRVQPRPELRAGQRRLSGGAMRHARLRSAHAATGDTATRAVPTGTLQRSMCVRSQEGRDRTHMLR
jgi:hypothetical protein